MVRAMSEKIVVLLLALIVTTAARGDKEYANGYTWMYSVVENVVSIYGYWYVSSESSGYVPAVSPNPVGTLAIPQMLCGKPLTCIGGLAFANCNDITILTIPDSVTNIDCRAFADCRYPQRIDFKGTPPKVVGWYDTIAVTDGTYLPEYESEWRRVIYNGNWYGIRMSMYEPPPPTLVAESADWANGAITLCCADDDISGTAHTYTLSYYDENAGGWTEVDGAKDVSVGADGKAHLTDAAFSSRLGGIPPVKYRVIDENGRVSAECVTRTRYGLFVGVGEYENGVERGLSRLPTAASDASSFKEIAEQYAKFIGPLFTNENATTNSIDSALNSLVNSSQSGDICLFYVTTHGDYDGGDGVFCLYDADYTHSDLTKKVSLMASKGVAFVAIIGTCHAEAMLQMDFPNAAVVAAATMSDLSTSTFDEILMNDGWRKCCAANGPVMTFEDLADYAIEKYNGIFAGIDFVDEVGEDCYPYRMSATKNDVGGLLGKIVARSDCTSASNITTKPSDVSGFFATTNNSSEITVSWGSVDGADRYYLFFGRVGQHFLGYEVVNRDETNYTFSTLWDDWIKESSKATPIQFMIKAYNVDAGAGPAVAINGWLYKMYAISFYTIDREKIEWNEPSFDQYNDYSVVKNVEYGDEYTLKCLPEARKSGYYLKGWYDLDGNEATVGQTFSSDAMYHAEWREIAMPQTWLDGYRDIVERSGGDLATAAAMTAANGTRTVDECYRLGIDPEDPNDDFKIADFKIEDGKPVITLNHTKDGSGNSFEPRIKKLGKAMLSDAEEWREVPEEGDQSMRFFKVEVEMP